MTAELRQRVDLVQTAQSVLFPLTSTLATATTEGGAQTIGTVPSQALGLVERLVVCNQTGTAATINVNCVPDGGTAGASNREISSLSVAANSVTDLTDLIGGLYAPGTTLQVWSGTTSALLVSGYIKAHL